MSSAASLDCASTFKASSHKQRKTILLCIPLLNIQTMRSKHCVLCFAVIFHERYISQMEICRSQARGLFSPHVAADAAAAASFFHCHTSLLAQAIHSTAQGVPALRAGSKQREMQRGKTGPEKDQSFSFWKLQDQLLEQFATGSVNKNLFMKQ